MAISDFCYMEFIRLNEVIDHMQSGKKFAISYYTADKSRNTGGFLREYDEAKLLQSKDIADKKSKNPITPKILVERNLKPGMVKTIQIYQNGQPVEMIRKVFIPLIHTFNGKELIL
jgi:hypothetical protein